MTHTYTLADTLDGGIHHLVCPDCGIDLDPRNADLATERVGMFLTVEGAA